jgi:hypothetical protein
MSKPRTDEYAFPHTIEHLHQPVTAGMTLRDYFAAKAMQAMVPLNGVTPQVAASVAYTFADAMLKARGQA